MICISLRPMAAFLIALFALSINTAASAQPEGAWTKATPAPTARTEVSVAALEGEIYVVGGFTRLGGNTALVEVYDPATDRWRKAAPLPSARHHAGIGTVNGKLYVIGGFQGIFSWTPRNTVFEYDPKMGRWTGKHPMPTARGGLAVGVHNGKLYAVGGYVDGDNTGANEVYDPATDTWTVLTALPTPRDHLAVSIVGDILYAIGGRIKSSYRHNLDTHEAYDIQKDRWTRKAPLPTTRSGIASALLDGVIFVFGGESPDGTFNKNEAYDPKTDRWTAMTPMPTARHGLGAAVINKRIHVLCGGPRPGGSFSDAHEVFSLIGAAPLVEITLSSFPLFWIRLFSWSSWLPPFSPGPPFPSLWGKPFSVQPAFFHRGSLFSVFPLVGSFLRILSLRSVLPQASSQGLCPVCIPLSPRDHRLPLLFRTRCCHMYPSFLHLHG